jgi:hypothetical protein
MRPMLLIMLAFLATATPALAAENPENQRMFIESGLICKGKTPFTIQAIHLPDALRPETTLDAALRVVNAHAARGANSVSFDLHGFDPATGELAPEAARRLQDFMHYVSWQRMAGICHVFGGDAPADPKLRPVAARSAALALREDVNVVYVFDNPEDRPALRVFRRAAPRLLTAAPAGAPVRWVAGDTPAGKGPAIWTGTLRPEWLADTHFVLPAGEEHLAALEDALTHPLEREPWVPGTTGLSAEEAADGWLSLFDGTSLDAWIVMGEDPEGFVPQDGAIVWQRKGAGWLRSRRRFDNFVLRFEWRIGEGGNSGVFLRAPRAARASKIGMEFQIMGDHGQPVTTTSTGSIYDVREPLLDATRPEGEWNEVEITLDGPRMTVLLNGQTVQNVDLDADPELSRRLRSGFIGLQDHGDPVAFRNLRIKTL